ncbi:hypothetical protein AY606_10370 [Acinetobacter sp. SFB]|uniref:pilin n=1 Tax=Acinetobacter sp. SFB TaxID=1805634 RepID=UPI0007D83A22|nr:pilin [Acinetobacter sp. SFB]OAL77846.1 hypothetical protein AY606_10370 [Acinetobacter sp. SFB]
MDKLEKLVHIKGFMECAELMIVVVFIGILAAIAIHAYQDSTKSAKFTEGLSLASSVKNSVAENTSNVAPYDLDWATPIGIANVTSIGISKTNGEITITYTPIVSASGVNTLNLI